MEDAAEPGRVAANDSLAIPAGDEATANPHSALLLTQCCSSLGFFSSEVAM